MYCHTSFWSEVNLPARLAFRLLSRTVPSAQRYPSLVRKPPRASRAVEQPPSEGEGSCSSSSSPKSLSTWAFHCTVTACRLVPRNSWSSSSISSKDVRKSGARKAGARVKAYRDKRGKGGKGGGVPRFAPYRSSRSAGVPTTVLHTNIFQGDSARDGDGQQLPDRKGGPPENISALYSPHLRNTTSLAGIPQPRPLGSKHREIQRSYIPQSYKRSAKPLARSSTMTCANQICHYSGTRTVGTSSATNVP